VKELDMVAFYRLTATYVYTNASNWLRALKSRDLTSRDPTTRHQIKQIATG